MLLSMVLLTSEAALLTQPLRVLCGRSHGTAQHQIARRTLPCRCTADDSGSQTATVAWREEDAAETVVPSVSLTRSRDGSTGTATFTFDEPKVLSLNDVWDCGLITGLWLRDKEGVLVSTDLDARFEFGRPKQLVAILVLKSRAEWDRFMRFMARYAETNELSFESAGTP
jgi:photosystem II 13kDa protein